VIENVGVKSKLRIVEDNDNDVYSIPDRGLKLGQVIPKATIAGEADYRPVWYATLDSD
jgi:hypothetical protein